LGKVPCDSNNKRLSKFKYGGINMKYKNTGYNRLLVGDLYHWAINDEGYFFIGENKISEGGV